jgi:hypothetical protein
MKSINRIDNVFKFYFLLSKMVVKPKGVSSDDLFFQFSDVASLASIPRGI